MRSSAATPTREPFSRFSYGWLTQSINWVYSGGDYQNHLKVYQPGR